MLCKYGPRNGMNLDRDLQLLAVSGMAGAVSTTSSEEGGSDQRVLGGRQRHLKGQACCG